MRTQDLQRENINKYPRRRGHAYINIYIYIIQCIHENRVRKKSLIGGHAKNNTWLTKIIGYRDL